jgi:hypothetical protein
MKYVLEFDIPREKNDFIDAANGTTLRELLQEHVALLEGYCEGASDGMMYEARLAQDLLEDLKSKLSKMQKLPR